MNNEVSAAAAEESEEAERSESQGEEFCEESRIPKTKRSSHEPTNEEIRIHEVTHVPYRSWCPCCVAGRGKSDFHLKRDEEDKAVAGVHVDYWFLRQHRYWLLKITVPRLLVRILFSRKEMWNGWQIEWWRI